MDPSASVRRLIWVMLVAEAVLVVLDYVFNVGDIGDDRSIRRIFNVAREQSLPTWFSSMQALAVGVVAAGLGLADRLDGRRGWGFWGIAAFFTYVSADDAAEIHERVGSAIERASGAEGLPTYAWQLFVAPVLAVGLLACAAYGWSRAERPLRRWLLVALACFAVSQGLDFWEGMPGTEPMLDALAERLAVDAYLVNHTPKVAEEWLEMLGTTAFLYVWSAQLAALAGARVRVVPPGTGGG